MIEHIVFLPMPPVLYAPVAGQAAVELDGLRSVIDSVLASTTTDVEAVSVLSTNEGFELAQYLLDRITCPIRPTPATPEIESAQSTALLVMGDGTAKRSEKAPGYIDNRAEEFDDQVKEIFESANLGRLTELDEELARELWVAGIGPWKTVGSWVAKSGSSWKLNRLHVEDPYGVAYFVASYERIDN